MLNHSLLCHPTGRGSAVRAIDVAARCADDGALILRYRCTGDPQGILMPAPQPPAAADGLWQHTCCEAFVAAVDAADYREFNFSPSGQWAAYRFSDYRERDGQFEAPCAPQLTLRRLADGFQLDVRLAPALLPSADTLLVGLSAVVEAADGGKSYWALRHGAVQPDFHLRQSFALTLKVPPP